MAKKKMVDHKWLRNNNGTIAIDFNHKRIRYKFNPIPSGRFDNQQDRDIASQIACCCSNKF